MPKRALILGCQANSYMTLGTTIFLAAISILMTGCASSRREARVTGFPVVHSDPALPFDSAPSPNQTR